VLTLNEQTMQATLVLNADLGNYSFALGGAQQLPNGNYVFTSGFQGLPQGPPFAQSIEVLPDGTPTYVLETNQAEYRSYRLSGLYQPPDALPELAPIADQKMLSSQQGLNVGLSVANPSGHALTFAASCQSLAYMLSRRYGSLTYDPGMDNRRGRGEKWLQQGGGQWYFLLPSGELYQWDGSSQATGTLLGNVGVSYYSDPTLLANPAADQPHATFSFSGSTLTITRDPDWISGMVITVTTSNDLGSDSKTFNVTTVRPPTAQFTAAGQSVNENAGTFHVTVTLSGASTADVTIPFTLGGTAVAGLNYTGVSASPLLIKAGQTSATISGTLLDDGKFSAFNKTLTFTLGTPTNATLGPTTTTTLTIVESDPKPSVAFAVLADNSLWEFSAAGWRILSPARTVLAVSGVIDGSGADVVFAITADHNLWEHDGARAGVAPFKWDGWAQLSAGSFRSVSAAFNTAGSAVAFGVLVDGSLWEYNPAFSAATGHWLMLSPAGTILSASAVSDSGGNDVVFAITADHNLWEHDGARAGVAPFKWDGWAQLSAGNFQSVSAGLNGAGAAVVYGVLADASLWEDSPAVGSPGNWQMLSPAGTILGITAAGRDEAFAVTADHNLWQRRLAGWALVSSGSFRSVSGNDTGGGLGEVFGVLSDSSLWEFNPAFPGPSHWQELIPAGVLAVAAAK
jgi:hypothetical protein